MPKKRNTTFYGLNVLYGGKPDTYDVEEHEESSPSKDFKINVYVFGARSSGKTALIDCLCDQEFNRRQEHTAYFGPPKTIHITVNENRFDINFHEVPTSNTESFFINGYRPHANVVIYLLDITDRFSLSDVKLYLNDTEHSRCSNNILSEHLKFLVVTKSDRIELATKNHEEIREFAQNKFDAVVVTSAKERTHIDTLKKKICTAYLTLQNKIADAKKPTTSELILPLPSTNTQSCDKLHRSHTYNPYFAGRAVVYSTLFAETTALLTGKRKLFANTRAAANGKGKLFADTRAMFAGKRPLFANTRTALTMHCIKPKIVNAHECHKDHSGSTSESVSLLIG